ncbi:LexA family protein [Streptomyces sp. NPDC057717]|uniref:LexA family protein n=1 Tax=unclassified Streptomyces TaxID=2593676 RepID=UPI003625ECBC
MPPPQGGSGGSTPELPPGRDQEDCGPALSGRAIRLRWHRSSAAYANWSFGRYPESHPCHGPCADSPGRAERPAPRARGFTSASRPTARQEAVLRVIRDVIANTGGAPTVREISQRVGLSSSGSVAYQLAYLEKLSVISRNGRHWRSSRLTGQRSARTGRHCRGNPAQGLSGVSVSSPVTLSLATGAHLPGSMKARKYSGLHS